MKRATYLSWEHASSMPIPETWAKVEKKIETLALKAGKPKKMGKKRAAKTSNEKVSDIGEKVEETPKATQESKDE